MSQPRRFVPPPSSNAAASHHASQRARSASPGRAGVAAAANSLDAFSAPLRLASGKVRKPAAFAQLAFSLVVAACDVLVIVAAAMVADTAYQWVFASQNPENAMVSVGASAAAMFVLANSTRQEYRFDTYMTIKGHVGRSVSLWATAFICLLAIGFVAKVSQHYSRGSVTIFFFIGLAAIVGARIGIVALARRLVGRGGALSRRVALVGYAEEIAAFRQRHEASTPGVEFVGAFPLRRHGGALLDIEIAAASARGLAPDEVFILVSWSHTRTIDACLDVFRKLPVAIHLAPEAVASRFAHARISQFGSLHGLDLVRRPLSSGEVILKRLVDLVGASVGLAMLAPLFLLVAILIKLDSPGRVLFSQKRYGFNQQPFRILKFRTMTCAEDGPGVVAAQRDDPRVTRVGRWLRRFNIDELPQLVNVLRGEMSLVGPRPHASSHDEMFERSVELYARRHNIKPGITGWAQVNGFRGEIKTQDDILRRVEHDLFYLDNWSIWLDFTCIWRTVVSARAYRNAY